MIHSGKTSLRIMLLGVFLPLIQLAAAPKVELSVTPDPVRTGEEAYLVIRSNDGSRNTPRRLPKVDGLTWQNGIRQQSRVEIINGRRSSVFEAYVPFSVTRPGKYTIPGFRLTHSNDRTSPVSFEAVESRYPTSRSGTARSAGSSGESLTADQIMFMEMEVPGKRDFYYLGEEIPLEVNIFVLRSVRPQLSWPQIVFGEKGGAVFRDYRKVNPENPQFSGATQREVERDGRSYLLCSFRTAIRPISAGKLQVTAKENAAMIVPDNRRQRSRDPFDDFFEDSFFSMNRQVPRNMTAGPLTLEIRNLPPAPDGVRYTGLAGSWNTRVSLSPPPYKVGETITLKIEFDGTGSTDTLRSWQLDLPGFRVYPPEVEKNGSGAEIRYVLIPTEPSDGKKPNITFGPFATFENGKYQIRNFSRAVRIEPGTGVIPAAVGPVTVDQSPSVEPDRKAAVAKKRRAEEILYLKKQDGRHLSLPLTRNLAFGAGLILAGVAFFVVACIVRLIRSRHENDPVYRQKMSARRKKPELLAQLKKMSADEFPAGCAGDIASYIADAEGLPPGADLTECAEAVRVKSPELAKMLDDLSQAAWMPSLKARFTPEFRRALIKALSRLAVLALILFPSALPGAEKTPADPDAEALNAYDTGKFSEAEKYYRARLNPAEPSAELLYNIGSCLYQQGKLPQALVCFERALRLSPRDPDILENLNLVRRKLILKEHGKVESPADILPYLRDSLRPDEWLTLLCAGIALLFFAGGIRLLGGGPRLFRGLLCAGILLIAVPGAAYYSQQKTCYDPDFAVVVSKALPVYSLPSDQAGKVEMNLRAGDEAVIVERRLDWVRIRTGAAEGWVRASGIASLWSPESAAPLE